MVRYRWCIKRARRKMQTNRQRQNEFIFSIWKFNPFCVNVRISFNVFRYSFWDWLMIQRMNMTASICATVKRNFVGSYSDSTTHRIQKCCCRSKIALKATHITRFWTFDLKFYKPNEHIFALRRKYYKTKLLTSKHFVQVPSEAVIV